MARALWKGAISFGLVNVPVELYPAEERKAFEFAMLDRRDLSPVGYKRYSKTSGKEVEWANVVKGYEYEKDQYVVLSDEDFRRANVKATQTIDIRTFVDEGEIPTEYFETPYYLAPARKGGKVYALLRETLRSTRRVAIAQVVIRTTPHLAAVAPNGRALILVTLRYPDELRGLAGLDLPPQSLESAGVSAKEIALAKRLVDDMTEPWNPAELKNTYHDDLMARIRQKIKQGQTREITMPEGGDDDPRRARGTLDLAKLLRQSLGKGAGERKSQLRAEAPVPRARAALRLVAGGSAAKRAATSAIKPAARRKRA